jgi:hypothetical protein
MADFKTLYVNRPILDNRNFHNHYEKQGIILDRQLHCTVIYSKTELDWSKLYPNMSMFKTKISKTRKHRELGPKLALVINSVTMFDRYNYYLSKGAVSDYDSYVCHISICETDFLKENEINVQNLIPYSGIIKFGPEILATTT